MELYIWIQECTGSHLVELHIYLDTVVHRMHQAPHLGELYIWIQWCIGCTSPSGVIHLDTVVHRMHLT